ncbi:hypothetical protein J2S35_000654 [Falsarthrobacter nasiphocae]|uniref:Amino acid transporter n=2 Tax=Falsarthrobacter nasiphocae TaxID=189863 RepID=A0AAE4C6R1_9MICC|nr:hypothetical protein [Falsarthrobacter nasiphocae]
MKIKSSVFGPPRIQSKRTRAERFQRWLFQDSTRDSDHGGAYAHTEETPHQYSWWKVMCLTGVDYFSTLGYQPAIAAAAAGLLSPIATIVLVLVTLFGALPVYRRVALESPHGQGSIAMLERLFSRWNAKLLVLALIGFAATDFMITMTLSAADATAHVVENPFVPHWLGDYKVLITLAFITALCVVFVRGFSEAIGLAVVLVVVYLGLNVVVIVSAMMHVTDNPQVIDNWWLALTAQHTNPWLLAGLALLAFPRLALGLSGFETGVAVIPQIQGRLGDDPARPMGRIKGAHHLLTTAAVIMSVFLIASSFLTIWLIPLEAFEPGGPANGRALAYLAHEYLGEGFGTAYDISTVAILWFAGASAMAGLLNLVPRYLPRYGMAPAWASALRPLVLVITAAAWIITIIFDANVEAQGGAYATGVLVLITSAAFAVAISLRSRGRRGHSRFFGVIALIFTFTTLTNIVEKPDGVKIASVFILAILVISFVSRARRSFELRATTVHLDDAAYAMVKNAEVFHFIAHEPSPSADSEGRYTQKTEHARAANHLPENVEPFFIEVFVDDSSDFEGHLEVRGVRLGDHRILQVHSSNVPNTIAAVLLHIRNKTGRMPHVYFRWTEGNPIQNLLKYLLFGQGEVAPVTREVLREAEPDTKRRPWVHVG